MIELLYSLPPWLVAATVVLLVLLLAVAAALVVEGVERRRNAAAAIRWQAHRAQWRAAQVAVAAAATGETERLACCPTPDYPPGSVCCIKCGRRV